VLEIAAIAGGALVVLVVLWELFETIVSPRRVSRRYRLTRGFYRILWRPWRRIGRVTPRRWRESFLAVFGPASLLALLLLYASLVVGGFALLHFGVGSGVRAPSGRHGLPTDLYASGAAVFTLTPGDLAPTTAAARVLTVLEAGTGIGMLAIVIGYLPVVSQGFSRREVNVSLLDARAGSPPSAGELLLRNGAAARKGALTRILEDWELWSADLLETHVSFPVLAFYRSQHANQSWVAALTAILDTSALLLAGVEHEAEPAARLTFATARHAAVDLALIFHLEPKPPDPDRLPHAELAALRKALRDAGLTVHDAPEVDHELARLRALYEPYMNALASFLLMPLPAWRGQEGTRDSLRRLT
jgi:hypothetical protein